MVSAWSKKAKTTLAGLSARKRATDGAGRFETFAFVPMAAYCINTTLRNASVGLSLSSTKSFVGQTEKV